MGITRGQILELVLQVSRKVMEDLPPEQRKTFTPSSQLVGGDSPLDSLALAGFVIELQEALRSNFGVALALADERALTQPVNPFSTVDALTDYAVLLLQETAD
jgi:hypothetical protein